AGAGRDADRPDRATAVGRRRRCIAGLRIGRAAVRRRILPRGQRPATTAQPLPGRQHQARQDRWPDRRAGPAGYRARPGLRDHGRLHDQLVAVDRTGLARRPPRRVRRPRWPAVAEGRPRRRRGDARRPAATTIAGTLGRRHPTTQRGHPERITVDTGTRCPRTGRSPLRRLTCCLPGLLLLAGCGSSGLQDTAEADVVIHGGLLFDGSDNPGQIADIALQGDRILYVGPDLRKRYHASREIDATGMVVSPGLIDPHTHPATYIRSDDPAMRRNLPWLHQGVSTIFIGIDGNGTPDVAAERAWFE